MSQFAKSLHHGIAEAQRAAGVAQRAGHPYEAYLHRARLHDLLEVANRNGVEAHVWVAPEIRQALIEDIAPAGL